MELKSLRLHLASPIIIKDTLDNYCFLSGQWVNFDKSATYFSKETYNMRKRELAKILGARIMTENERYLGNPLIININKNISFQSLVGKVKNRIMSWKTPLLSQVGKNKINCFYYPYLQYVGAPTSIENH